MTGYYSNLALHISETTLKAQRRLDKPERPIPWAAVLVLTPGAVLAWGLATWALEYAGLMQ